MDTLEELKNQWGQSFQKTGSYNEKTLSSVVQSRVSKHIRLPMQYFWASFALQLLVYACLSHIIIRFWHETTLTLPAIAGFILFVPFTVVLMTKFKQMATLKARGNDAAAIYDYVLEQRTLIQSFFTFKKRYEMVFIPVGSAIGVLLTFQIFVPGGIEHYFNAACIIYIITLASCFWAIYQENKKNFKAPLQVLDTILSEYRQH